MNIGDFQESLDKLREEKKIKSYRNYSSANQTHYIIQENPDVFVCDVDNLKLTSHLSTTNMILFDPDGKIKKYESVDEIVVDFCKVRMQYYTLRKNKMLSEIKRKLDIATGRKMFITEIMDDSLVLKRKKEDDVVKELEQRGYQRIDGSYNHLLHLQINSFTEEKLQSLSQTIEKHQTELESVSSVSEEQMWISDLDEFERKYNDWVVTLSEPTTQKTSRAKQQKKKGKQN
jgi:DNA topoisomerase-2